MITFFWVFAGAMVASSIGVIGLTIVDALEGRTKSRASEQLSLVNPNFGNPLRFTNGEGVTSRV
jgi:hypothetical protein